MGATRHIQQLTITLAHVTPSVWRRVQAPAGLTLRHLAATLITAMGWHGGHLHQFRVGREHYSMPEAACDGDLMGAHDERATQLADWVAAGVTACVFDYDFGDGWEHTVRLEGEAVREHGAAYPRCVDGARACPPEDCGGPDGYARLLRVLCHPRHAEHAELRAWVGGAFDPEMFNLAALTNLAGDTRRLVAAWSRMRA